MKGRILLIGYNFHPEPTGIGKYSGEMLHWLARDGYDCTALTAYPYYPHWWVQAPYHRHRYWYRTEETCFAGQGKLTVHRCPMYVPARPSGARRALLDATFLAAAALKLGGLVFCEKFDLVIVIAPSFQLGLLGVLYQRVRHARFLYHIQDLQIEAARDFQLIKSAAIIRALLKIERFILNRADLTSTISPGMAARVREKARQEVLLLPNWTDVQAFYPLPDRAALKREFGFAGDTKILLYSGAIGEKQGLEAILTAAQAYRDHAAVQFLICGSGPYKQTLQQLASRLALPNVVFFPVQPPDRFNRFLNMADVHFVIQKASASDLVMPSKLTTILAVGGLALLTADAHSSLHALVQAHRMGLLVKPEDPAALQAGIHEALTADNQALRRNARRYAEEFLSIERIMAKFKHDVAL